MLAEDVVFRSPIVFKPYEGRDVDQLILTEGAMKVFEDFRYTDRFENDDEAALIFEARVGDRELQGIDYCASTTTAGSRAHGHGPADVRHAWLLARRWRASSRPLASPRPLACAAPNRLADGPKEMMNAWR